jgi:ABC-type phosphate/phosphonate transport system permease subunit
MKTILGMFGAGIIGAALLASPAQAACAWNVSAR